MLLSYEIPFYARAFGVRDKHLETSSETSQKIKNLRLRLRRAEKWSIFLRRSEKLSTILRVVGFVPHLWTIFCSSMSVITGYRWTSTFRKCFGPSLLLQLTQLRLCLGYSLVRCTCWIGMWRVNRNHSTQYTLSRVWFVASSSSSDYFPQIAFQMATDNNYGWTKRLLLNQSMLRVVYMHGHPQKCPGLGNPLWQNRQFFSVLKVWTKFWEYFLRKQYMSCNWCHYFQVPGDTPLEVITATDCFTSCF